MKKRDISEIKTKGIGDLNAKIAELKRQKVESILQVKMAKTKNVHEANSVRKNIAKIETILRLKVLAGNHEKKDDQKPKKEELSAAS